MCRCVCDVLASLGLRRDHSLIKLSSRGRPFVDWMKSSKAGLSASLRRGRRIRGGGIDHRERMLRSMVA